MPETKIDLKKTALLVIDMQNDTVKVKEAPFNTLTKQVEAKGAIANTAELIAAARKAGMKVIYACHIAREDASDIIPTVTDIMLPGPVARPRRSVVEGTYGAQIVDELKPQPGDHVITKRRSSAFYGTDLELILRSWGIDTLILTGIATNFCIANAARAARERDLHYVVASDCIASFSADIDEFFIKRLFPLEGRVRTSKEIIAAIAKADA